EGHRRGVTGERVEMAAQQSVGKPAVLDAGGLAALTQALLADGYTVVGPTVRGGSIVLDELSSSDDLPWGWGVDAEAGHYRLRRRTDRAAFGHAVGPQSWKRFLSPPRTVLWRARRDEHGFLVEEPDGAAPRYALLGVRPCDLRAIAVQDRVLTGGRHVDTDYATRRAAAFVVAVECTEPAGTCFCASTGSGPGAGPGYDVALTEVVQEEDHWFLARAGSGAGGRLLARVPRRDASAADVASARAAVEGAATRMGRRLPTEGLRELFATHREDPHWDEVGSRCLTCANCTLVCPTCFCTTVEDVTDLAGDVAERRRRWDSCFDLGFSYLHGDSVRSSNRSRYRHWISHKLGTWQDQFGELGCVGCGRCITWCPVGIDITAEAAALRDGGRKGGPA
ncbi:MAG TPA: 4Fe-4S dicluster domain-containing protein, partial [Frankiaceae bacterium]|nr:4Fe-4S dicluster domain-containing protein [Frankiaceae bacterium]